MVVLYLKTLLLRHLIQRRISPVQVTHVACQGGNSGAINITVSGGSGVYTYHWSNSRTTQDIQNIAAGTYTVTVTDSQGCSAVVSAVVNPRLSVTTSATAVICNGGSTGTATALAVGGAPGYSYLWNNGGTTATISNLTFGTYRVTVTDALGCTRTSVIAVTQPQAINITGTTSIAPCASQPGGGITISVFNAIAPATYLWSDGATTQNRTGIVAGTYTVTVTGANGCTKTKSFTVTSAASMVVTFTATQPTCGGNARVPRLMLLMVHNIQRITSVMEHAIASNGVTGQQPKRQQGYLRVRIPLP